jgi:antirestriction protein ArdC
VPARAANASAHPPDQDGRPRAYRPGGHPETLRENPMTHADTAQHLQQQITDGIAALTRDRQWVTLLDLTARTGSRYSLGNLLLIGAQRPQATVVCGYRAWAKAGRQVRRGERGIRILAPIITRRTQPGTEPDPDHSPDNTSSQSTAAGTATKRTRSPGRVVGFRPVVVFDIEQTDGPPRPSDVAVDGYTPDGLRDALTAQINEFGYQVRVGDCRPAFGITRRADRTVTILPDQPPAQDALTLAHELGHLACGHLAEDNDGTGYTHRGTAEVEAESVAYILVTAAGMNTAAASFDYIGTWAHGDTDLLRATAATVIRTSRPLLAALGLTPADPTNPTDSPDPEVARAEVRAGSDLAETG